MQYTQQQRLAPEVPDESIGTLQPYRNEMRVYGSDSYALLFLFVCVLRVFEVFGLNAT